ncbi:MAG: hypothetical protein WCC06_10245 [Candidatus Aminicenantales bacterium]
MTFRKSVVVLFFCLWPLLLCGQGAFILFNGRNHPELSWSVYETDHFRIVYSDGLDETAKRAGSVAEQVYAVHQKNLGLTFKKKYYIFISDMDDIVNGATSPFGYMFIWVNPSDFLTMFTGTESWLEKVIAHEMMHALIFENARGWLDSFIPLSSLSVRSDIHEGMAQFYAGEKWGVERGDRYLNQGVRNYSILPNPFDLDFGPMRYARGFAKVKWLRQTITDGQLGKIFSGENAGALFNFKKSFKNVTGRLYSDMEKEWKKAINVYFNWREAVSERTETIGAKLEKVPGERFLAVKASPDGKSYAFTGLRSFESRSIDLYLWEKGKSKARRLAQKGINANFSFDPQGRRIVFSRRHYGKNGSFISDLYVVDVRTAKEKAVTRDFRAMEPVFIDAHRIVFVRQEGLVSNFYLCRADGGSPPEKLTEFKWEVYFSDLSVSRGGKKVAASFLDPGRKKYGIIMLDVETKALDEKIMPDLCRFPLFCPENPEEILLTSQEGDVPNVFRLNLQTDEKEAVTYQSNYVFVTDWPDEGAAIGIRQTQRQTNEVFTLDPYRKPQMFSGTLQDYYTKWIDTQPSTPMVVESKDVPGRFRGAFHSLSTFRPLLVLPFPVLMKERLSFVLTGYAADMMGKNLLLAAVAFDFQKFADTNYFLTFLNRSTVFDIAADVGYGDVTTYRFRNEKNLYEGVTSVGLQFSMPFSNASAYTSHRLSFGFEYEKSAILNDSFDSNPGASEPKDMGEQARPYRMASLGLFYKVKNIQPYLFFPGQGIGAAVEYRYHRSFSGGEFSYHYVRLSSFVLRPLLGKSLNLYMAADMQAVEGKTPPQNRLGMAKYYTSSGLMAYSDQIYIRGGDRYFPGNRLLTASMEMYCPLPLGMANMVVFLDMARIWENGLSAWKKGKVLTSYGVEMQLPSLLGSSVGLGMARNISERQPGKWKFYLTVRNLLPF